MPWLISIILYSAYLYTRISFIMIIAWILGFYAYNYLFLQSHLSASNEMNYIRLQRNSCTSLRIFQFFSGCYCCMSKVLYFWRTVLMLMMPLKRVETFVYGSTRNRLLHLLTVLFDHAPTIALYSHLPDFSGFFNKIYFSIYNS